MKLIVPELSSFYNFGNFSLGQFKCLVVADFNYKLYPRLLFFRLLLVEDIAAYVFSSSLWKFRTDYCRTEMLIGSRNTQSNPNYV